MAILVKEMTEFQKYIQRYLDLITAEKKDSQGLCFIGKVRLPEFLQQKLQPKGIPLDVINMADYGMMNGEKVLDQAISLMGSSN